jgi:outer membrane protein TolC
VYAALDELAFAILGVEAESRAVMRRLSALRDLYDLARRRGGVGAMTLTDVFADGEVTP